LLENESIVSFARSFLEDSRFLEFVNLVFIAGGDAVIAAVESILLCRLSIDQMTTLSSTRREPHASFTRDFRTGSFRFALQ
jgi:hypothetical protein